MRFAQGHRGGQRTRGLLPSTWGCVHLTTPPPTLEVGPDTPGETGVRGFSWHSLPGKDSLPRAQSSENQVSSLSPAKLRGFRRFGPHARMLCWEQRREGRLRRCLGMMAAYAEFRARPLIKRGSHTFSLGPRPFCFPQG